MKNVAGLDVRKDSVYLCILQENGEKIEKIYGVLTPELDSMRDLLVENNVGEIAMESIDLMFSDENLKPIPIKDYREYMKERKKEAKDNAKADKRK